MDKVEMNPNEAALEATAEAPPSTEGNLKASEPSMADYAAQAYQQLIPKFKNQLDKLSGVQSKRILIALMEFPFEKSSFDWPYKQAEDVFKTGIDIMDCRFVLTRAAIELTMEQKRDILIEAKEREGEVYGRDLRN